MGKGGCGKGSYSKGSYGKGAGGKGKTETVRKDVVPNIKSRKIVGQGRTMGVVDEWKGTWGWLMPLQKVVHPFADKNRGRVYVHKQDIRGSASLEVGMHVDFVVYADGKGLGGSDCREVTANDESEDALPEGWEKIYSEEHKEFYYWHKATKQAAWTRPDADDDDDDLPEGWTKAFDEGNQQHYYWNKATKTASWERPSMAAEAEAPAEDAEDNEVNTRASAEDLPVLGQQRMVGQVSKWQGFFGWISPSSDVSADLKPLLERNQGQIYVNWRDVQKGLKMEVGVVVDFLLSTDDNGLVASDVRSPKAKQAVRARGGRDALSRLEAEWAEQDAELGIEDPTAAADVPAPEDPVEDEGEGKLLPGWEPCFSEEHGCNYYWHAATKQASWERPAVPVLGGASASSKVWEGEGAESAASKMATPITPFASKVGREITPITPGAVLTSASPQHTNGAAKGSAKGAKGKGRPTSAPGWQPAKYQRRM